ncbi:MAG: radical SAM protein [Clostridiales bacterium]|nr:radical SAM protein [Clostridiales bacterium]
MGLKQRFEMATAGFVVDKILKYIDKDPEANLDKIVDKSQSLMRGVFPSKSLEMVKQGAKDPENIWRQYGLRIIKEVDKEIIKGLGLALGIGAVVEGTRVVRANREKYKCNIPWIILLDPTSACNLKCKGCWSAEYGNKSNLTYEEMADIVKQGKELGVHFYMFTGGEPLVRKNDIIKLCEENKDCAFLAYTNATLVDQDFCNEMKRVKNITLAISIEGDAESTNMRRGENVYERAIKAMDLLKENRLLFGISVCYTRANLEKVTSDEFIDLMIEKGAKYGFYFNYMPVGSAADVELVPTPEQREFMYGWMKKCRDKKTGKPIFTFDFQDDAEYVGGCIAGGRNYFHINSNGDMEPCVFIHYSDSNIREKTILEALQSPLFMSYYHNQPFNDNHLRPCPMLENPEYLRKMVERTGAKSTDMLCPEDVNTLCARCEHFAKEWAPKAEELWKTRTHPTPKAFYYRDLPEAKKENMIKFDEKNI